MSQVTIEKTPKYLIVKIPLKSVEIGKGELSRKGQKIIDRAVAEGLRDIEAGRVFGPFRNTREFKKTVKKLS